jgi:cytochrome c556
MQKMYVLAIVTALVVVGALAQSESDYQAWMKSNPVNMGSLNKNIAAKDGAAAAADAQKLEATFKQVEDFWKKRGGADDAVNFAMKAQMAAAAVAKDALGGNFDQAAADVKSLQANCGGCHMAHREGAAGILGKCMGMAEG